MVSDFSCVRLFETLWTVVCQALLSMVFSRQEYWSGVPCPPPGGLPHPGIEPMSLAALALQAASLLLSHWGSLVFSISMPKHATLGRNHHRARNGIPESSAGMPLTCSLDIQSMILFCLSSIP